MEEKNSLCVVLINASINRSIEDSNAQTANSSWLLFVDTWGWCASSNPKETQHQKVRQIMETLLESGKRLITTNFVLDETYTLVRFRVHHQASVELHQKIEQLIVGKLLKVIHITPEIEQAAWRIFERYSDKDFSFTDCISFIVMFTSFSSLLRKPPIVGNYTSSHR